MGKTEYMFFGKYKWLENISEMTNLHFESAIIDDYRFVIFILWSSCLLYYLLFIQILRTLFSRAYIIY